MRKTIIFSTLLNAVLFLSSFGLSNNASAQLDFADEKLSTTMSVVRDGDNATVILKVEMVEHWHINAVVLPPENFGWATTFVLNDSPNFKTVGGVIEPKPLTYFDELSGETISTHEGTFKLKRKIKILSDKDFKIEGSLGFQTCDENQCLPPFDMPLTVKVKAEVVDFVPDPEMDTSTAAIKSVDMNSVETADATAAVEKEDGKKDKKEDEGNGSIWVIFFLSFASGFAALLTPCVFPMIPMTVSFFTKQSKTKAQGIKNAIIYGVSIIAIYILLGTVVTAAFGAEVLNEMSTNPTFNIIFFILLVVFAISFMGAFEIRMPSKWVNKADSKADKGGLVGIFFMALALALVSFSCTGPIVGSLLVQAASEGGIAPVVGMFGFSLALALPFALFAAFPGWMNSLPKSGGWLNTVKVVLGFLELALAFKFLSNADLSLQAHMLEREIFLAIWIGIFLVLSFYLLGFITLPHDSKLERLSVGRTLLGTTTIIFVLYMIPGLWGAPLKLISAFPPPLQYSESPLGFGGDGGASAKGPEGTHLGPQNIWVFHDYDKALAYAKEVGKPLFVDFTGHNCVNCRKMEQSVWGEDGIIEILRDKVVIVSLHVDERTDLPKSEQKTVTYAGGRKKFIKTVGDKWMMKQIEEYKATAQPYYIMQNTEGEDVSAGPATYRDHNDPIDFEEWLKNSLK
ncbi:MAG: thiol:disulfide interchange protein DsbD [Salibacteraceae bacterium]|jgi:thiol:disulfide interchange protein DsbD